MKKETYKIETKKVKTIQKTEYFCDKCGKKIVSRFQIGCGEYYNNKIKFENGETYPEYGEITKEIAYLCPECAEVVKELLIDNGVKFTLEKSDY